MMFWYEPEVKALERDLPNAPNGDDPPVFYGSSSFRLWTTLAEDFDPHVLNLAFGGSTLEACAHFFDRLVTPVHPRSILIYAGDNDLGDGRSVDDVFSFYRSLARKVAALSPSRPFGFVSVKPSPARFYINDRIRLFNDVVRADIEARPSGYYVDVYSAMLTDSAGPRPEFFLDDGLHLNREGYRLWGRLLQPFRDRILMKQ